MAYQTPDNERLSRVEDSQEELILEIAKVLEGVQQLRAEMRNYFVAIIIVMIAMWVSLVILSL